MSQRPKRCLVVTAAHGGRTLTGECLTRLRSAVDHEDIIKERALAPHEAWEMLMTANDGDNLRQIADRASRTIRESDADVNIIAGDLTNRRKRLLVADMESTIIEQEMLDELADYAGLRERISGITERAMRGEVDFEQALKERVAMLAGLDARLLDEVYDKHVTFMPGAKTLLTTMKANGAYCALVSGGFTVFTQRVAAHLGFDEHQANELEIENGKLTGRISEPILGRAAKRQALEEIASRLGLQLGDTLAVGDGANDLDMLSSAGLGVAFRAKPKVQTAVRALPNGAVINHGDLSSLLYLQGFTREEFRI